MPQLYESMRDSCLKRKKKKNGKLSNKDKKECKKMAAYHAAFLVLILSKISLSSWLARSSS